MIMKQAKDGKIIPEIEIAAKYENMSAEKLRRLVANGHAVIPKNITHEFPHVRAIGEGLKVKVNVNLGTSKDCASITEELKKLKIAEKYGADAVMDLSTGGDIDTIRKRIISESSLMIGTVPIYQAGIKKAGEPQKSVVDMTEDDMFNSIEKHGKDGVDFITVHCGINRQSVERLKKQKRKVGVVSRGGSFLVSWMAHNNAENPLYANYDYLLEIAEKYEMTLSLGDGMRPGGIADATDRPQLEELIVLGELVDRARVRNVQTMVEGPGHIPLHQVPANMHIQKTLCRNAPFYVLGPLVTDIFPGYDHITGAIGGAIAAMNGASFLCYVTPSEHLCLPDAEDVRAGLIASKIAAHAVDITRGIDIELDYAMDKARYELDWEGQFASAGDREKAEEYRNRRKPQNSDVCTMCGDYCAIKQVKDYIKEE